jgi:uncharacterized protein
MVRNNFDIPYAPIAEFCRRWKVDELSFFGSVLRDDFRPDSDIDVLLSFNSDSHWTLFDWVEMQEQLAAILGRKVDLLSRRAVEGSRNPIRRKAILSATETVYAAR